MNSLKNILDEKDIIGQIIFSLNSDIGNNKVYVLVEGINDYKLYPKFFDKKKASIEYTDGKLKLIEALKKLNKVTKQIIGICDADFSHLQNISPSVQNLFFTDFHDIEMTMLSIDGVLDNVLSEYHLQNDVQIILQKALNEAKFIGYVRWFNEINSAGLNFAKLGLGRFIKLDNTNVNLDNDEYLQVLNKRSEKSITLDDINNFIKNNVTDDIFNLCCGHDVTAIIALMIGCVTSHERFCFALRLSFNIHYFRKTRLYADILKWQTKHGFSIFRADS